MVVVTDAPASSLFQLSTGQYFVITDIGKGCYQWYAFLARPPGSAETEEMPDGKSMYLQNIFTGWSGDIHHILKATQEHEIEQRDLYDRPPSVRKPWTDGNVCLLGDSVHAMMVRFLCIIFLLLYPLFLLPIDLCNLFAAKSRSGWMPGY
jgi:2-polyprenyl-6-methoxyphenol hydroxylase-like FAD-dependent oxidoreductase